MPGLLLPLFPLQVVLFPRTFLPLHIFEERYKEMFGVILARKLEFGVVQANEKGIVNAGCTATVERVVRRHPDGQLDLLTVGRRRFELLNIDEERAYLRGEVEFFDDEEEEEIPPQLIGRAMAEYESLKDATDTQVIGEPQASDPQLSFQLAQLISDLEFRQLLLGTRSETERLRRLMDFLPGYVERQRYTSRVRELAPRNGHAKAAKLE